MDCADPDPDASPDGSDGGSLAQLLELLAAEAWPAPEVAALGGWRLRATWGLTRRANSVLAIGDPGVELHRAIQVARDFYSHRGLPICFQVSATSVPQGLAGQLERRGFREESPTLVQVASVEEVAARAVARWETSSSDRVNPDWFAVYQVGQSRHPGVQDDEQKLESRFLGTLLSPLAPALFVIAQRDGAPAAVGQGVLQRGWLSVQCMATLPEWRGQGASLSILGELARWAVDQGVDRFYLSVMESNQAGRALYDKVGFTTVHRYSYWSAPTSGAG